MKGIANPGHERHDSGAECFRQKLMPCSECPARRAAIGPALRSCPGLVFLSSRAKGLTLAGRVR